MDPAARGTYEVQAGHIVFTNGDSSDLCLEGDDWTWEAMLLPDGRLRTVVVDDGTGYCSPGMGVEGTWPRMVGPQGTAE